MVRGRVRHMRPLPSDSTTATEPVSAIRKLAPLMAVGMVRNFLAEIGAGGGGQGLRVVGEIFEAHAAGEDLAHLAAIDVQRGNDDVRGLSSPSCRMISARSVS
jgi:hypothetical protein